MIAPDKEKFLSSPIFIGGAGRSGTSLLRTLLNTHPNIAIGTEFKATPFIARMRHEFSKFEPHLQEHFALETNDIDNAFSQLIFILLNKYREQREKPRVGEKTPNNVFFFYHIHQMFPESPLIHVIRDGRDVVCSLLQKNWTDFQGNPLPLNTDPEVAANYWKKAILRGRSAREDDRVAARYIEVRYENLVANPEATMKRVLHHINEPWDASILDFHVDNDDPVCPQVLRPISTQSVGKWRSGLTEKQKSTVKRVAGNLLVKLGYASNLNW